MRDNNWRMKRLNLDPNKYRNKSYVLRINVPNGLNVGQARGSLVTDNKPFVLDYITHMVEGLPDDMQTARYALIFRDVNRTYNTDWALATLLFGHTAKKNSPLPLTVPAFFEATSSLIMDVDPKVTYLPYASTYPLLITFHGFERWQK